MFKKRPQSAKLAHGYRSTNPSTADKSGFNFRKKLEREILDSDMVNNRKNQLASNFLSYQQQVGKFIPQRITQSPERLYEQNLILKKEINSLQVQLQLFKGKLEAEKRKATKYTSQLDVQYEKQMFWAGPHMITGVKRQYEKLKLQLEQTQKQLRQVKRIRDFTDIQELTVERDQYKSECSRLIEYVNQLADRSKYNLVQFSVEESYDRSSQQENVIRNRRRTRTSEQPSMVDDYEQEIERLERQKKLLDNKIDFLQNRLIDKENTEFSINTSNRKLTQEVERLKQLNQQLTRDVQNQKEALRERVQEVRETERKRHDQEVLVFSSEMDTKNKHIVKLQKEIGYLSTLLSYWKPLDEQEEMRVAIKKHEQFQIPDNIMGRDRVISFKKEVQESKISVNSQNTEKANPMDKSIRLQKDDSRKDEQIIQTETKIPSRVTMDSNSKTKKNYALKRYKVKKEEIIVIGEEIKYKLLDSKIEREEAIKMLDRPEGQISIAEIIEIFMQAPFNVRNEESAILMARYLVEDQNDQIIYYDPELQNDCLMVKSIFEQVIPRYRIPSEAEYQRIRQSVVQVFHYLTQLIKQYNNMLVQTIVSQVNSKCILTKQKLVEVLTQQELNHGPQSVDFMVALLLKDSADINHLEFRKLASRAELQQ